MSPISRFREFISYPSHSRTLGILAFLVIVLAIPLTVNIAQKQQELRQQAANSCDPGDKCTGWSYAPCTVNGVAGYHPICATHNVPDECYPGAAPDTSTCSQSSPATCSIPNSPPFSGGTYSGQSADCNTVIWFDPQLNRTRTFVNGVEQNPPCSVPSNPPFAGGTYAGQSADCKTVFWFDPQLNKNRTFVNGVEENPPCSVPSSPPFSGGTYAGQSSDCKTVFWFDPATGKNRTFINGVEQGVSTPTPATPAPTTPPTAPPISLSCPGSGIPGAAIPGNIENWGGSCSPENQDKAIAIPGTCSCTVAVCKKYSGGPLCWVNNGQRYDNVARDCKNKGADLPDSCFPLPDCNAETTTTTCQADINTCNGAGKRNRTLDKLSSGGACKAKGPELIICPATPTDNCSTGNVCQNGPGPSGQCVTPTVPTPIVTPTPGPGNTFLSFTLGLDGLGSTGDNKNPFNSSGSNKNPNRKTRNMYAQLIDSGGSVRLEKKGYMKFTVDGKFNAGVDLGAVASGTYTVKVKSEGYLWRSILAPLTIVDGDYIYSLSSVVNLVTGDINGDNVLDSLDYNQFSDCFKNNSTSPACDLDDDGKITLFDLNLFLRELPVQHGD